MIDRVESILNVRSPTLQQLLREASENFGENPQFWVRSLSLARLGEIWKLDNLSPQRLRDLNPVPSVCLSPPQGSVSLIGQIMGRATVLGSRSHPDADR
jgi:hypothetical protein